MVMGNPMIDTRAVRTRAEYLYRSGQLLCSEAVLHAFNEALGKPLPQEAVRLASGFPVGMGVLGTGGCVCGALSGGVMVLGLVHGRANPGGAAPDVLEKSRSLHDWFQADKGSTCCRVLVRDVEFGSQAHIDQCVAFTGDVAEHLADMLNAEQAG